MRCYLSHAVLLLLCVLLTGCITYDQKLRVAKDGIFEYSMVLSVESNTLFGIGIPYEEAECEKSLRPVFTGDDSVVASVDAVKNKVSFFENYLICTYKYSGTLGDGFHINYHYKSNKILPQDTEPKEVNINVNVQRVRGRTYSLQINNDLTPSEDRDPYKRENLKSCSKKFVWQLEAEKIYANNGVKITDEMVEWAVCSVDAEKGYPYTRELVASFAVNYSLWERFLRSISGLL